MVTFAPAGILVGVYGPHKLPQHDTNSNLLHCLWSKDQGFWCNGVKLEKTADKSKDVFTKGGEMRF